MKRYTLCKACFCVLALLFLTIRICRPQEPLAEEACGGVAAVYGTVGHIREREREGQQEQIIISLHSVTFCTGIFPEENSENTGQGAVKQRAEGVLCYMAEGTKAPLCGENIVVSGRAERFRGSRNPGGFDARAYYRTQGIDFYVTDAVVIRRGETYSGLRQALHRFRQAMADMLEEIGGEDAGIMQAMLLGDKDALPAETKRLYQQSGISHILAISGLHISFLGLGLYRGLKRLRIPAAASGCLSGAVLCLYIMMTGGSPSSVRAGMMFLFGLAAELLGRSCERMTALAVSALVLAAGQPFLLAQSGFLMSYGAILGLELLCPVLEGVWDGRAVRPFLPGISISAVTLPVILNGYFEFPVYSFFLNLLVIPLTGAVMALGLGALAAGCVSVSLGRAAFWPVHLILGLIRISCRFTEKLPGHTWITGQPAGIQILLYYGLVLALCLLKKYMTKCQAALFLCAAVWILTRGVSPGDTLTMLDVGQGDGVVMQSAGGAAVLVDCGSSSERDTAAYTLLPYLKSQKLQRLEYVFLTHMDSDHINGVEELLTAENREIEIGTLVLPAIGNPDEVYERIVREAEHNGIRTCRMGAGDSLAVDDLSFVCLHPEKGGVYGDRNGGSLVLYMSKGDFSALLTGDLDGEAEEAFAEGYPERFENITVLKAGHHGSKASCGETLLSKCMPRIALVSCGEKNRYGHPDAAALRRLAESRSRVCVTKDTGALRVYFKGGRIRLAGYNGCRFRSFPF